MMFFLISRELIVKVSKEFFKISHPSCSFFFDGSIFYFEKMKMRKKPFSRPQKDQESFRVLHAYFGRKWPGYCWPEAKTESKMFLVFRNKMNCLWENFRYLFFCLGKNSKWFFVLLNPEGNSWWLFFALF